MSPLLQAEIPPLREDAWGALRVGDSQVLLEIVVRAFQDGKTPETIVQQYPTTSLADVYAVIGYYLRHREEIGAYLAQREMQAEQLRVKIEAEQGDMHDVRQRLIAHRKEENMS